MAKAKSKDQLTSVKVNPGLFEDFKVKGIRTKINLQKLVDRSIFLYLTDESFEKMINNQINTMYSGSI